MAAGAGFAPALDGAADSAGTGLLVRDAGSRRGFPCAPGVVCPFDFLGIGAAAVIAGICHDAGAGTGSRLG